MKKKSERLKPIHRIVSGREQEAAKALAESQNRLQESRSRQDMLTTYRQDYINLFHQAAQKGISGSQLASYQAFITQLDSAISNETVQQEQMQRDVETRRRHWLLRHQKTQVMENAIGRFQSDEQQVEEKREQKLTDEQAQRTRDKR